MPEDTNWNERYRTGDLPWDTGKPDKHLLSIIREYSIKPCPVLEIGCGTGTNALWLAQQHFEVTAVDVSSIAIEQAREKSSEQGAEIQFMSMNILEGMNEESAFDFIFDRGCFHSFASRQKQVLFVAQAARMLREDGLWFSMMGNDDAPPREMGPPRRTALDIVVTVEPFFEILCLQASYFDSIDKDPPRCWTCLMRKR